MLELAGVGGVHRLDGLPDLVRDEPGLLEGQELIGIVGGGHVDAAFALYRVVPYSL